MAAQHLLVAFVLALLVLALFVFTLVRALYTSVPLRRPTNAQLDSENHWRSALFRAFPRLIERIAWRSLVDTADGTSPLHKCSVRLASGKVSFWAKREDLACSSRYGGNKVRTLEHQLACCEASSPRSTLVLGSGGSNFVVATLAHARHSFGARLAESLVPLWVKDDFNVDRDNTLNVLSSLSFVDAGATPRALWAERCGGLTALRAVLRAACCGGGGRHIALPPGGNSVAGALGHVGAALELAEQIIAGDAPAPTDLFLTVGSGCTLTGLLVGIALASQPQLAPLRPAFAALRTLHAQVIHHAVAALQRRTGLLRSRWLPLLGVGASIKSVCAALGALDATIPAAAVEREALRLLDDVVRFAVDAAVIGKYGGHTAASAAAAACYAKTGTVEAAAPPLWLCGHFTAKTFATMLRVLERNVALEKGEQRDEVRALFWSTKSAVQPRAAGTSVARVWERFTSLRGFHDGIAQWADRGGDGIDSTNPERSMRTMSEVMTAVGEGGN